MSNEIKDLSGAAALLSQLKELLSLLISIPDVANTETNPGKQLGDSTHATKDLSILEESSVTSKMDGDKKLYLLHHATTGNEYEKSVDDAESAEESSNEYKTSVDTEWSVTNNGGDDLAIGKKPVVSCWIPESSIKEMKNAVENTGTWGEMGENPFIEEFRVVVKPGTYTIYSELKKSWSKHMQGLLRKSGFLSTTSSRHPAMKTNNATGMIPHPKKPKDIPHVRADSQTEINFRIEKSDELEKDVGRITAPKINPKWTRPDQQVVSQPSDRPPTIANTKKPRANPGSVAAYRANKESVKDYGHPVKNLDSHEGQYFPEGQFGLVGKKGVNPIKEHEAHHLLVDKLVKMHGLDKVNNLYDNLISKIHPGIAQTLHALLASNSDYKKMKNHTDPRYHLHYKEEVVNLLRDMVNGSKKTNEDGTRDGTQSPHLNNRRNLIRDITRADPNHFHKIGVTNERGFDNALKSSWKTVRDAANNTNLEDLK